MGGRAGTRPLWTRARSSNPMDDGRDPGGGTGVETGGRGTGRESASSPISATGRSLPFNRLCASFRLRSIAERPLRG